MAASQLLFNFQIIILLLAALSAGSFHSSSAADIGLGARGGDQGLDDLAARLVDRQPQSSLVFNQALSILNSFVSAPSCHRLAAWDLINTCESLEKSSEIELALEEVKEKYAVRLAMCELTGAAASLPAQCRDFVPSPCPKEGFARLFRKPGPAKASTDSQMCYPITSSEQVRDCLNTLHSTSQSWTSYSNAAQNVVVVCQATRAAMDKQELLDILKSGTRVNSEMTSMIETHLTLSANFATAVEDLQNQVLKEQQDQLSYTRTSMAGLRLRMQQTFHSFMESMTQGADEISGKMSALENHLDRTNEKIQSTDATVDRLLQQTSRGTAMAASQVTSLEVAHHHASEILEAMARFHNSSMAELGFALQFFTTQIQNFSQSMADVESRINRNSEMLDKQADTISQMSSFGAFGGYGIVVLAITIYVLISAVSPVLAKFMASFLILSCLVVLAYKQLPSPTRMLISLARFRSQVDLDKLFVRQLAIACGTLFGLTLLYFLSVEVGNWYRKRWSMRAPQFPADDIPIFPPDAALPVHHNDAEHHQTREYLLNLIPFLKA